MVQPAVPAVICSARGRGAQRSTPQRADSRRHSVPTDRPYRERSADKHSSSSRRRITGLLTRPVLAARGAATLSSDAARLQRECRAPPGRVLQLLPMPPLLPHAHRVETQHYWKLGTQLCSGAAGGAARYGLRQRLACQWAWGHLPAARVSLQCALFSRRTNRPCSRRSTSNPCRSLQGAGVGVAEESGVQGRSSGSG